MRQLTEAPSLLSGHAFNDPTEAPRRSHAIEARRAGARGGGRARIRKHGANGGGARARVARRVEPPTRGRHDLERSGGGRRHDRPACRERLDEREPERLAVGAVEQAVGVRERRARVVDVRRGS